MKIMDRPWMAEVEIKIMDSLFRTQQPKRVLEWGAGGSTLYWPQRYSCIKEWITIEYDEAFAEAVLERADAKVAVLRLDSPQYWRWAERLGLFDMIIVDGQHRVECLKVARDLLADKGVVVLHDSGRSAYNDAWKLWPRSEELYPGELPTGDGYYKHRGVTVFWKDDYVPQAGWCRDYQAGPLKRPRYKLPKRKHEPLPEPEPVVELTMEDAASVEDSEL